MTITQKMAKVKLLAFVYFLVFCAGALHEPGECLLIARGRGCAVNNEAIVNNPLSSTTLLSMIISISTNKSICIVCIHSPRKL